MMGHEYNSIIKIFQDISNIRHFSISYPFLFVLQVIFPLTSYFCKLAAMYEMSKSMFIKLQ